MSIQLVDAVLQLPLAPVRKLVLLGLANAASDEGCCWPNQQTIARYASISDRAVRGHLHALAEEGWIKVVALGNGRGNSTEYLVNASRVKAEAEQKRRKLTQLKAEDDDTKAEDDALKAEARFRPTVNRTVNRTVREPCGADAPARTASSSVKPVRGRPLSEDDLAAIRREYEALGHPDVDAAVERCRASPGFRFGDRPRYLRDWLQRDVDRHRERSPSSGRGHGSRTPGHADDPIAASPVLSRLWREQQQQL